MVHALPPCTQWKTFRPYEGSLKTIMMTADKLQIMQKARQVLLPDMLCLLCMTKDCFAACTRDSYLAVHCKTFTGDVPMPCLYI